MSGGEGGAEVDHHTGEVIHKLLVVTVTTVGNIRLHVQFKWELDVLCNLGVRAACPPIGGGGGGGQ